MTDRVSKVVVHPTEQDEVYKEQEKAIKKKQKIEKLRNGKS
jgi:hypothetical protein